MPSTTPAELLTLRRRLILDRDADGFAALFAPDAVIELPFAGTPDAPSRIAGRDAIREYAQRVMSSPLRLEELEVTALHETKDPEVVIVEMRAQATLAATPATNRRSFSVTSVQILRVREGLITLFRDFADPRVLAEITAEAHGRQESR